MTGVLHVRVVGLAILLAACQAPREGFEAARTRLEQGDLVGALVQLDRVAPTDPDYAESRSLATAIERRIRTSQRLFARGLALRAQWRDEEAISYFELARQVWPRDDGAAALIEATQYRIAALGGVASADGAEEAGAIAVTQPIDDEEFTEPAGAGTLPEPVVIADDPQAAPDPDPVVAAETPSVAETLQTDAGPSDELPAAPAVETSTSSQAPADHGAPAPTHGTDGADVVLRARLGQAAAALRGGRLDDALRILEQLHRSNPDSREVKGLWVRVLHQRALLHYGQGELALAVDAWGKVLEVDPGHAQARQFHDAARSELDALRRR